MRQLKYKSQIEAVKAANIGKSLTKSHKKNISLAIKSRAKGLVIVATNIETKQKLTFESQSECARYIGVSRMMISHCVNEPSKYKQAHGWKITTKISKATKKAAKKAKKGARA